jgi:microcystin-dependent protein
MAGKLDPRFLKPIPDSKVNLTVGATAGKTISQALTDKSLPIGGAYDSGSCPIGSILPWTASALPSNGDWLLLDGTAIDKTVYAPLFALFGSTYNTGGETASQFRLPDFRGRSPIGAGQGSGLTNRLLGARFGTETHTIAIAELPSHNHGGATGSHGHGISDPGHAHWTGVGSGSAINGWGFAAGNTSVAGTQIGGHGWLATAGAGTGVSVSGNTASITAQGGGSSHNLMHPCIVVSWIIRWRVSTQGLFLPDGTVPMVGALQMGGNKIAGVAEPIATTDAATKNYADTKEPALGNPSTDGYVLISTAAGARSWANAPTGGGGSGSSKAPTIQKILSGSGNYTPSAGATYIRVIMAGGGGGGGVGAGAGIGGNGGNTTFGASLLIANGGYGGANNTAPGTGGTASIGAAIGFAIQGESGDTSLAQGAAYSNGGRGGSNAFSGGGGASNPNVPHGLAGIPNTGGGGAGGAGIGAVSSNGGSGGGAGGYVNAIISNTSPAWATSFSYSVGAGGGGATGGSGGNGGAGGSGVIIIEEYYTSLASEDEAVFTEYATSSGQSIPANVETTILFNSLIEDTNGSYNPATGVWTCKVPGRFKFSACVLLAGAPWAINNIAQLHMLKNGGASRRIIDRMNEIASAGGPFVNLKGSTSTRMNVNDTVVIQVFQNTSAAKSLHPDGNYNYLTVEKLVDRVQIPSKTCEAIKIRFGSQFTTVAATWQKLPFNTITRDNISTVATFNTSLHRLTANVAGWYEVLVTGYSPTAGTANERYALGVYLNGNIDGFTGGSLSASDTPMTSYAQKHYLNVGDYIEIWMFSIVAMVLPSNPSNAHEMRATIEFRGA